MGKIEFLHPRHKLQSNNPIELETRPFATEFAHFTIIPVDLQSADRLSL